MSIKEARKILGKDADHLSDNQINSLIIDLTLIANKNLKHFGSNK